MGRDVKDLARKLKALADRGIDGEKVNAARMLEEYLEKHNLSLYDIDDEQKHEYLLRYKNRQKLLLRQIIFVVLGKDAEIYKYRNRKDNIYIINCTKYEKIQIDVMFEFYWKAFERDYEIFERAFIDRNDLYPRDSDSVNISDMSKKEQDIAFQVKSMASGLRKHEFQKRLTE